LTIKIDDIDSFNPVPFRLGRWSECMALLPW